jgi:hypothetical protein
VYHNKYGGVNSTTGDIIFDSTKTGVYGTPEDCANKCVSFPKCIGFQTYWNPADSTGWCYLNSTNLGRVPASAGEYNRIYGLKGRLADDYTYYYRKDAPGGLLIYKPELAGKIEECIAYCNSDVNCLGFTTRGEFKREIQGKSNWVTLTYGGLYVKKTTQIPRVTSCGGSNKKYDFLGNVVFPGNVFDTCGGLVSSNGRYIFVVQSDITVALYDTTTGEMLWNPITQDISLPVRVSFTLEGILVMKDVNGKVRFSSTNSQVGSELRLRDDGLLVILNTIGQVVWTHTDNVI